MRPKKSPKTRTFDSIASAAGALGIDAGVLKWAKRKGAPGFIGGRVQASVVLEWLEKNKPSADEPVVSKDQAILLRVMEQVRDLRRKNDEKERVLVARAWVAERMASACSEHGRTRQSSKDARCVELSAQHGVTVAAARMMYDQATEDSAVALRQLAEVFS